MVVVVVVGVVVVVLVAAAAVASAVARQRHGGGLVACATWLRPHEPLRRRAANTVTTNQPPFCSLRGFGSALISALGQFYEPLP